jgi:hypothetical protein
MQCRFWSQVTLKKEMEDHVPRRSPVNLAIEGGLALIFQQQLGHANLLTIATLYLRHIAPVELVNTMHQRNLNSP